MITGSGAAPVNHVLPAWDLLAGMTLAMSVVVAERHRRITGAGEALSLSLWDVALAATSHLGYLAEAERLPEGRSRYGNYHYGGFGCDFQTRDGRVMVTALSHRQWLKLVEATGLRREMDGYAEQVGADFAEDSDRQPDGRYTLASYAATCASCSGISTSGDPTWWACPSAARRRCTPPATGSSSPRSPSSTSAQISSVQIKAELL